MRKRVRSSTWAKTVERSFVAMARSAIATGRKATGRMLEPIVARRAPPAGAGDWMPGLAAGVSGARRFRLYRPPGVQIQERLPLIVMLHGCGQDAQAFAACTQMNRVAQRERFLVLYPEQDRLANGQGCWNWFETASGRAYTEAALILKAIDQVCLLQPVDRSRVAIAGLSAGASMAALLAARHPERFKAVVMHSGVPPGTARSGLSALGAMHGRRAPQAPMNPVSALPPLMVIHGAADSVVSPRNAEAAVQTWADAAGARAAATRQVQRGRRYPMAVTDYKRSGRTVATLVEVATLAHAWSGGAANKLFSDAQGPDAARMVWAFAARQFR